MPDIGDIYALAFLILCLCGAIWQFVASMPESPKPPPDNLDDDTDEWTRKD